MQFQLYLPTQIFAEPEAVAKHQEEFGRWGKRCLIVTGAQAAKKSGALDDVTAALEQNGVEWQVFDKVGQNPLLSVCLQGGQQAAAFGAEFVVGIGGGSALDAAKAVAVFGANPDLPAMGIYDSWVNPALPILLVGTTAGTGSEINPFSVLTIDETGVKRSWNHPGQSYAKAAFGDARYTYSLSHSFTMSTGLDAVCHALEAYFSNIEDSVSDLCAVEAVRLLLPVLRDIWATGAEPTPEQRTALYLGSLYAGFALNRCGTACCHMMGYCLTEEQQIPHGYACALFLPEMIRYAVPLLPQKAHRLFKTLGLYAGELCQSLEQMTEVTIHPLSEAALEALLLRWDGSKNMLRMPGDFTTAKQREMGERILCSH
ncbi:MAG: iron-containing alcohol dehydrogenase [Angelakisella sp.]